MFLIYSYLCILFYHEYFLWYFVYDVILYCYIRNRVILSYRNFVLFFSYAWENSNNCSSHFDNIFYFRSSRICSYVFPKRFSTLAGTKGREIYIILEINIFLLLIICQIFYFILIEKLIMSLLMYTFFFNLFISLSLEMIIYLLIYFYIYFFTYVFMYVFIYLFIHLFTRWHILHIQIFIYLLMILCIYVFIYYLLNMITTLCRQTRKNKNIREFSKENKQPTLNNYAVAIQQNSEISSFIACHLVSKTDLIIGRLILIFHVDW